MSDGSIFPGQQPDSQLDKIGHPEVRPEATLSTNDILPPGGRQADKPLELSDKEFNDRCQNAQNYLASFSAQDCKDPKAQAEYQQFHTVDLPEIVKSAIASEDPSRIAHVQNILEASILKAGKDRDPLIAMIEEKAPSMDPG